MLPAGYNPHHALLLTISSFRHLITCLVSVGIMFMLPGEVSSTGPAPLCSVALGANGVVGRFSVLAALCSPDHLWSITRSPLTAHHPSGTVKAVHISCFLVSRSLGQESCPAVTFLSQPLLNSSGMMAGLNPDQQSTKSILS